MESQKLRRFNAVDELVSEFDRALRAVAGVTPLRRPIPEAPELPDHQARVRQDARLSEAEKNHSAGLMRINHVGEVCAQALYQSQKLTSRSTQIREKLNEAALEEEDHLAWCAHRLEQLGSRPSFLNPLWYLGSFAIGSLAGFAGDRWSLGFVAETEHQVEKHLDGHLETLPSADFASKAIVLQMRSDEIAHGNMAREAGGANLPRVISSLMEKISRLMTKTAYRF